MWIEPSTRLVRPSSTHWFCRGGVANPDQLRTNDAAVEFVKSFFDSGKPVAVMCHGPWTLVEADVVERRTLTSWPSLETDIRNAGGVWIDEEVVVCTNGANLLVSSRKPDDLPAFCTTLIDRFSRASAESLPREGTGSVRTTSWVSTSSNEY